MAEIMTVEELADYLRFSRKTMYRLLKEGEIPAIKIGNKWRFEKANVDRWLRHQGGREKSHILVVDDEPYITQLVERILVGAGYSVSTANDGATALAIVKEIEPDAVLLDIRMPGLDGYQVLESIRASSNIPVLMLTAVQESGAIAHSMGIGADDYIEKPFSAAVLVARIGAKLRRAKQNTGNSNIHQD